MFREDLFLPLQDQNQMNAENLFHMLPYSQLGIINQLFSRKVLSDDVCQHIRVDRLSAQTVNRW